MSANHVDNAATQFVTLEIDDINDANEECGKIIHGTEHDIPLVLIPRRGVLSGLSWMMSVPEGFTALLYKAGKFMREVEPGFHRLGPMWHVGALVSKQYSVYDMEVSSCPTKDNIYVSIDMVLVFHISDGYKFYINLGAEKLTNLFTDAVEEMVRSLARSVSINEVYDLSGGGVTDELVKEMNEQFEQYGVEIENVTVTSVAIPPEFSQRMRKITWLGTTLAEHHRKLEFERLENQQQHEKDTFNMEKEKTVMELEMKSEMEELKVQAEIDLLREEKEALTDELKSKIMCSTNIMKANAQNKASKLNVELSELTLTTTSTAEAEESILTNEAECYQRIQDAELAFIDVKNEAALKRLDAKAEAEVADALAGRREHELKLAQLNTLEAIANNDRIIIHGDNGLITRTTEGLGTADGSFYLQERMYLDTVSAMASTPYTLSLMHKN